MKKQVEKKLDFSADINLTVNVNSNYCDIIVKAEPTSMFHYRGFSEINLFAVKKIKPVGFKMHDGLKNRIEKILYSNKDIFNEICDKLLVNFKNQTMRKHRSNYK